MKDEKMKKDHIDRFAEVAKGLGLSHIIAEKLANFIHVEVMTAKKSRPTPSLDGVEGIIREAVLATPLWIYVEAIDDRERVLGSIVEKVTKALSPLLQPKVEWDEEAVRHLLESWGMINKERHQLEFDLFELDQVIKALTQHFQPPQRIWPEEIACDCLTPKEIKEGFKCCCRAIHENRMLAACKAAHPVKEIVHSKKCSCAECLGLL